ncbi:MAG TPA: HPr family phosphocarrier protein [Myxococcales bacterium LLY-WYZ-16_1]|jgi:phosphocarrier protein HPr|nr:HPr family phosphocarrier protein [Myxococcales bacterium LLY-WYZ-16_1]
MAEPLEEVYFRVDPRLVHATVMNAWVPELRVRTLLLADAEVANDARRRNILSMSAMDEADVAFCDECRLPAELLPRTLVLFSSLASVRRALDAGLAMDELNVGHLPARDGSSALHPAVYLGPEDLQQLIELQARGVRVYVQPLPHDPAIAPVGIPRPVAVRRPPGRRSSSAVRNPSLPRPATEAPEVDSTLVRRSVQVVNDKGLHLRAAHVLAAAAARFDCDVRVGRDGQLVNAKSLLGLTTLGAARGTELVLEVTGPDAEQVLDTLAELFASGFREGSAS